MIKPFLRDLILSNPFFKKKYIKYRANSKKSDLISVSELDTALNIAEKIYLDKKVDVKSIKVGLVLTGVVYDGFVKERDYNTKYERFLKNNDIAYDFYDPYSHDWIEKAKLFDLIIWHTSSDPSTQQIAESKIYTLEKILNIRTFPSFNEVWGYENKINSHYQYKVNNLPEIPTFVSHSKEDAMQYLERCGFPLISKIATGSSSFGVDKIKSKAEAIKVINEVFSYKGKKTYFPYFSQKDYVYFQEFISSAKYDLRVICIGDKLFGYYRYPNEGDFRASGAGNYEKKEIPFAALELSYQTKEAFGATCLATDMVYCEERSQFLIIESSIFIGIDTCEQLVVNNQPGVYVRNKANDFQFMPGKFWPQELTLKTLLENI